MNKNMRKERNDPVRMLEQRQQEKESHSRFLKELQEHIKSGNGDETFYFGGR